MPAYRWRCYVEERMGIVGVEMLLYATSSLKDVFDYLSTRQHLANKKRRLYIKELGNKQRYNLDYKPFEYDE